MASQMHTTKSFIPNRGSVDINVPKGTPLPQDKAAASPRPSSPSRPTSCIAFVTSTARSLVCAGSPPPTEPHLPRLRLRPRLTPPVAWLARVAEGDEDDIRAFYYLWALQLNEQSDAKEKWQVTELAIRGVLQTY